MANERFLHRRVLIFKSGLLPYSETFIREQALALSKWRAEVVGEYRVPDGLSLDGLDFVLVGFASAPLRKLMGAFRHFLGYASPAVVRRLKRRNAELIHVHFATEAVRAWPILRRLGLPLVITLHGQDITTKKSWWMSGRGGHRMKRYPEALLQIANEPGVHFVAVSEAIKRRAIEFGLPESKISVSYVGVDTSKFLPGVLPLKERRDVLFVGRLVEKKGCEYLLRAFHEIQESFPECRLVIVGDGPLENDLKRFAFTHAIRAKFLGALGSESVRRCLDEARVLCLPSIQAGSGDAEGFGLVILEAQASGVPVITSALGGAQEGVLHGESGYAHAERDVESIKGALSILLEDADLCGRFGQAARRRAVEQFDIKVCTQSLEKIYDHCVERGSARSPMISE